MTIDEKIAKRIKDLRESRNISRKELAQTLGITTQVLVNLELNRKKLDADTLMLLSEAFNLTTDEILGNTAELMTKEQALREVDPKDIVSRYYSLEEDSQVRVDEVIDNYRQIDKDKKKLEEEKYSSYLAAAHGSENMTKEEIEFMLKDLQSRINKGEFD